MEVKINERRPLSVSVVIATYNGSMFIEEQLSSILNQTYHIDEVLIADDGSTDETVKLIKEFIANHELESSWSLEINQHNKGYANNFMDLAFAANKDVVFFCDQDDIWVTDKVELMVAELEKNSKIKMLASDLELFYESDDALRWSEEDTHTMNDSKELEIIHFDEHTIHCQRSGCTMCVRRDFLNTIKPYWRNDWAQDEFVWKFSVISNGAGIYHYRAIKRRMHSNNATNIKLRTREKRLQQVERLYEYSKSLEKYILDYRKYINDSAKKEQVINRHLKSLMLRRQMLKERNIFIWLQLALKYRDCYPWDKALLLDGYFLFCSTHKAKN